MNDSTEKNQTQDVLLLIVKWGGELTEAGQKQAVALGKAFRRLYVHDSGQYGDDVDLGLVRIHSTCRHDLKIYASDEGRVQMTAAAFTKGFLSLEGKLPPILIHMVNSANTNGFLNNNNDCWLEQRKLKRRLKVALHKDAAFGKADYELLAPTQAKSVLYAMQLIQNPLATCHRLRDHVKRLINRLDVLAKESNHAVLRKVDSWDLLLARWKRLYRDYCIPNGEYDVAKIPAIYDSIKYDIQHNPGIFEMSEAYEFFDCAMNLTHIITPQVGNLFLFFFDRNPV